jgi:hypothetical protein
MEITEITVNISKKLVKAGVMGSDMASASMKISIEDESEVPEAYAKGWAICYEEIEKQEKELKDKSDIKEVADEIPSVDVTQESPDPIMTVTAPVCPLHNVAKVWKPAGVSKTTGKPYPGFYACPAKNLDGSFCKL